MKAQTTLTSSNTLQQTEVRQRAEAPTDTAREHTAPEVSTAGPGPLTAAQRGPEWMNRWGCPGFCVQEHGKPEASEFHTTAPAESSLLAHEVDSSGYSANCEELPWLTAQVVVMNDQAQAYGRETCVFLSYGIHLAELSPAKARQALDAMRGFVARLSAVVDLAEQVAADDFEGDPEIQRLDAEATARRIEARTAELLAAEGGA